MQQIHQNHSPKISNRKVPKLYKLLNNKNNKIYFKS